MLEPGEAEPFLATATPPQTFDGASPQTLITITGINIGRLMGGTVIVETIFALPGIGRLVVGAIGTRDLIILQGTVLCIACGYVLMNFIVDMLYAVIDPRIRHGHA